MLIYLVIGILTIWLALFLWISSTVYNSRLNGQIILNRFRQEFKSKKSN